MTLHTFAFLLSFAAQQGSDSAVAHAMAAIKPLVDSASLHQAGYIPLGFGPVKDLTPFQGQHWFQLQRIMTNPPVDLSHPTFVMYLPIRDSLIPVGVAYSRRIGVTMPVPTELAGEPVEWHTHVFCRQVAGEGQVLADGIEDCKARGGTPTQNQIAMVHTWTVPNPDGPYAHDNPSLPFIATGLKPTAHPTREDRLFGIVLAESYGARFPAARRIERDIGAAAAAHGDARPGAAASRSRAAGRQGEVRVTPQKGALYLERDRVDVQGALADARNECAIRPRTRAVAGRAGNAPPRRGMPKESRLNQ